MIKLILIPRNRPGLGRAGIQDHLEHVHGPLCMDVPDVRNRFRRYVHHYVIDGERDRFLGRPMMVDRDALTTIVFDDDVAMRDVTTSPGYLSRVRPDEANFCVQEGTLAFLAHERVIYPGDAAASDVKLFHLRRFASDVDISRAADLWADDVRGALSVEAGPVRRYVQNVLLETPDQGELAFNIIDEVWLRGDADAMSMSERLKQSEAALFDTGVTRALMTRQRIFIA